VKRLFILFLIVLLPLRGWAGDLMSMRMAHQPLSAGEHVGQLAAMPPDCPMHAHGQASAHFQPDQKADTGGDGTGLMKNCASCDLCLPLAALTCARIEFAAFAVEAKPLVGVDGFASAVPPPTDKPPIF
jgi:hypothetical protein